MNLNKQRIKSSRKDPDFSVYEMDGRIFRPLPEEFKQVLKQKKLLEFFPRIENLDQPENTDLFEIEKIPFIAHPYELPFELLKDCALFYIELLSSLLPDKISLKDATPYNIAYLGNGSFTHFDLGSIEKYDSSTGWKGYRQFLAEFYFPLLYLKENKNIYTTDLIKLFFDKQWIFKHKFKWKNYLNLGFNIHYSFYKNSAIKNLKTENTSRTNTVSLKLANNNLVLLKNQIENLSIKKDKTKWDDYYSSTILKDGYLEKKSTAVIELLQKINTKPSYAVDWGANDGKFSKLFLTVFKDSTVISIESDYNAANQLYVNTKGKKIIPIYSDATNLSPDLGLNGERSSLKSRLKNVCDFQFCLGLMHHIIHQEGLSFEDLISFFGEMSKAKSYFIIEFIAINDPRHQLVKNPNYAYPLTRDYFIESLSKQYEIIETRQTIDTRELFLCIKKT